nr:MAG TPA: hypothetical protein [Caudoviricetes sp.]
MKYVNDYSSMYRLSVERSTDTKLNRNPYPTNSYQQS